MRKLQLFYLESCPYCHNAKRALAELSRENPAYRDVEIEWIEESRQSALAAQYDYYYVPTVFMENKKLYEASPGESYEDCKENLRRALNTCIFNK